MPGGSNSPAAKSRRTLTGIAILHILLGTNHPCGPLNTSDEPGAEPPAALAGGAAAMAAAFSVFLVACGDSHDAIIPASPVPAVAREPWPASDTEKWSAPEIEGVPLRERSSSHGDTRFTEVPAAQSGLDFVSVLEPDHPLAILYRSGMACSGLAIGDLDGDGDVDAFDTTAVEQHFGSAFSGGGDQPSRK